MTMGCPEDCQSHQSCLGPSGVHISGLSMCIVWGVQTVSRLGGWVSQQVPHGLQLICSSFTINAKMRGTQNADLTLRGTVLRYTQNPVYCFWAGVSFIICL